MCSSALYGIAGRRQGWAADSSVPVRFITRPTDFYVDAVRGGDSNSGTTPGTAWKTINHGWSTIATKYVIENVQVRLLLQPGTYRETVLLLSPQGVFTPGVSGTIPCIWGNPEHPASAVTVNGAGKSGAFVAINNVANVFIGHVRIESGSEFGIQADWGSSLYVGDIIWGPTRTNVFAQWGSRIEFLGGFTQTITSGANQFAAAVLNSMITAQGRTAFIFHDQPRYANAFAVAHNNSNIVFTGVPTWTGSPRGQAAQADATSNVEGVPHAIFKR
jgi:hypothetical protein